MADSGETFDFLIVGAGVVGPALARGLALRGRSVLVLERDLSEPDRIVGELLQPGGVESLKKLGMDQALTGIEAAPIYGYQIIYNGRPVHVPYPMVSSSSGNSATAEGRGFHHGRFVMNLRRIASETPGVTLKQATVTEILSDTQGRVTGVRAKIATEKYVDYKATIVCVCDGTSSKFRKNFVESKPVIQSYFVGAVLKNPDLLAPNHGHVIIGSQHKPVLVYQTSETEARILCDVPAPLPSLASGELQQWLRTNSLKYLPNALKPSFERELDAGRLRSMPNQYLPAIQYNVPGLVILGDAMNMRHPLTGGGMTVGLGDAVLLSDMLGNRDVDLRDHSKVQPLLAKFRRNRKRSSAVVNVLSVALYRLFSAPTTELQILQNGCFEYFLRGGECVTGPVSLLSGLLPEPAVLFYHFFAVAFYGIYLNYKAKGWAGAPLAFIQTFTTLWAACVVFLPFLFKELVF